MYSVFAMIAAVLLYVRVQANAAPVPLKFKDLRFMEQNPDAYRDYQTSISTDVPRSRGDECQLLSIDTLTSLPGWDKLKAAAERRFRLKNEYVVETMGRGIVRDIERAARICVSPHVTHLFLSDPPACSSNMQSSTTAPLSHGIMGMMSTHQIGSEVEARVSLTSPSNLSIEGAKIGVPDLHGMTEFKQGTVEGSMVHKSNIHTESTFVAGEPGQRCTIKSSTTTCTAHGTGKIRLLASGTLWFNVDGFRHSLTIESVLKLSERSSYLEVEADITSHLKGKQRAVCA